MERYYLSAGVSDEVQIVAPKGSYVPRFVSRNLRELFVNVVKHAKAYRVTVA